MYAIIDAPGHHGDTIKVYRTFATLAEAESYRRRHPRGVRVVEGCEREAGCRIARAGVDALLARGDWRVVG
jgi:hypothetical protein